MTLNPVQSSHIKAVGYDTELKVLRVQFKGGEMYDYEGVPSDQYIALLRAPSIGSYFQTYIKTKYRVVKVNELPKAVATGGYVSSEFGKYTLGESYPNTFGNAILTDSFTLSIESECECEEETPPAWAKEFDERELKEIVLACFYKGELDHGTVGHLEKTIIAKFAMLLDKHYKPEP